MTNLNNIICQLVSLGKISVEELSEKEKRLCVSAILRDEISYNEAGSTLTDADKNRIFFAIANVVEKRILSHVELPLALDDIFLGDYYDDVISEALSEQLAETKFHHITSTELSEHVSGDKI